MEILIKNRNFGEKLKIFVVSIRGGAKSYQNVSIRENVSIRAYQMFTVPNFPVINNESLLMTLLVHRVKVMKST